MDKEEINILSKIPLNKEEINILAKIPLTLRFNSEESKNNFLEDLNNKRFTLNQLINGLLKCSYISHDEIVDGMSEYPDLQNIYNTSYEFDLERDLKNLSFLDYTNLGKQITKVEVLAYQESEFKNPKVIESTPKTSKNNKKCNSNINTKLKLL